MEVVLRPRLEIKQEILIHKVEKGTHEIQLERILRKISAKTLMKEAKAKPKMAGKHDTNSHLTMVSKK